MGLVNTTKGEMDESLLEKREGTVDNAVELTKWVEYWLNGELVHRSADVKLKPLGGAVAQSDVGRFA